MRTQTECLQLKQPMLIDYTYYVSCIVQTSQISLMSIETFEVIRVDRSVFILANKWDPMIDHVTQTVCIPYGTLTLVGIDKNRICCERKLVNVVMIHVFFPNRKFFRRNESGNS